MYKKAREIEIGDSVYDMHRGSPDNTLWIDGEATVIKVIKIEASGGTAFIENTVRPHNPDFRYLNKMLTVVDIDWANGDIFLKCAWSYDNTWFGMMEIMV